MTAPQTPVSFTAKDVMALRQKTGLGMLDCKQALEENGGDPAAAEEWLRAKLKGKMQTRTERATGEGRIGIAISGADAVILEVQTETDFTARNEKFVGTVDGIAKAALKLPVGDITPDDAITKEIDNLRITTGENVNFSRGQHLQGGAFGSYLHHDGKRAAIVQIEGGKLDDATLKGLCQHIVFHDPLGIDENDVPAATIDKIRADAIQEAKDMGKNEDIAKKMSEGKVRKHLQENTLLHQKYVLDETKAIKDLLPAGVKIRKFVRYTLGA